jgi:hypothetical protein
VFLGAVGEHFAEHCQELLFVHLNQSTDEVLFEDLNGANTILLNDGIKQVPEEFPHTCIEIGNLLDRIHAVELLLLQGGVVPHQTQP